MTDYEMQSHWSGVAKEIVQRPADNLLAGDDCSYNRYVASLLAEDFLPRVRVEGREVLDFGCGPGRILHWMQQQHPKRLAGCDQATEMVRLASQTEPQAEVTQIDGEHLPYQDNEFDVVTTITVLQHNPDARRSEVIHEICRVARQEIYLFEDTSLTMPTAPPGGKGVYQNFYARPVSWYEQECRSHGFSLVQTDHQETFVSHQTCMYLSRFFDRRRQSEGSPFSKLHLAIERGTMPLTKLLDKRIKNRKGELTMMKFTPTVSQG